MLGGPLYRRNLASLVLALLALGLVLTSGPDASGSRGTRAKASPNTERPLGEGHDSALSTARWFYGQRAYPRRQIPAGALLRSRQQAAKLPRRVSSSGAGPVRWTLFGPKGTTFRGGSPLSGAPPVAGRITTVA